MGRGTARRRVEAAHFGADARRVFGERAAAPHVAQLAANPMQLTILLHLIRTASESQFAWQFRELVEGLTIRADQR